jgi:hypothetical protein
MSVLEVYNMGEPMDRSNRVFMKLGKFEEAFPELEDVTVEFVEKDFLLKARSGTWHLHGQGGVMPCGNPSCRRGGYELDRDIREMLRMGVLQKHIELHCRGDEGSPKGRKVGRRCERSIEATVTVRFKDIKDEFANTRERRLEKYNSGATFQRTIGIEATGDEFVVTVKDVRSTGNQYRLRDPNNSNATASTVAPTAKTTPAMALQDAIEFAESEFKRSIQHEQFKPLPARSDFTS